VTAADARRATELWEVRATSTPTLDRFGRDLVRLATEGRLGPIVGREREIDLLVETLMRRTRRNPLLLGPAGSGKTAIVEGLAIRIAAAKVPEALRGLRLFDVALLPLAEEARRDPSILRDLLVEARHPSVAVFFDEIHQLAADAVADLAQALKPALARGEIACVGATTAEEYQASIESDAALARRFTIVTVAPMDADAVMGVLRAVADSLARSRGLTVEDGVLEEVIALGEDFLPNRAFPDKGVDILEQAVAHAAATGATSLTVDGVRDAVSGLIGAPLDRPPPPTRWSGGSECPSAASTRTATGRTPSRSCAATRRRPGMRSKASWRATSTAGTRRGSTSTSRRWPTIRRSRRSSARRPGSSARTGRCRSRTCGAIRARSSGCAGSTSRRGSCAT
jgi:MoxR-like ATPase